MFPFNRPQVVQGLQQFLAIKGQLPVQVDESIIPIVNLGDLFDTPYLRYGIPVAEQGAVNAVVAEFAYVCAQPGPAVALQINQVIVTNSEVTAQVLQIGISTAANITAASLSSGPQFCEFAAEQAGTLRPSVVRTGTHTSGGETNSIIVLRVPAGESFIWEVPPPGVILYGNDPGGVPALAAVNLTANEGLRVAFVGREWPLPG